MTRARLMDVAINGAPVVIVLGLAVGFVLYTQGTLQSALDRKSVRTLDAVFPGAARFSAKTGDPPHIKAYARALGTEEERVIGFVFDTSELEPYERGYDGPIRMVVGLDLEGRITGVLVLAHQEPYGYFSIDTAAFTQQFTDKSVRDRFRVGEDIDAITRATITVVSATRAIGSSARRVARTYLATPTSDP